MAQVGEVRRLNMEERMEVGACMRDNVLMYGEVGIDTVLARPLRLSPQTLGMEVRYPRQLASAQEHTAMGDNWCADYVLLWSLVSGPDRHDTILQYDCAVEAKHSAPIPPGGSGTAVAGELKCWHSRGGWLWPSCLSRVPC